MGSGASSTQNQVVKQVIKSQPTKQQIKAIINQQKDLTKQNSSIKNPVKSIDKVNNPKASLSNSPRKNDLKQSATNISKVNSQNQTKQLNNSNKGTVSNIQKIKKDDLKKISASTTNLPKIVAQSNKKPQSNKKQSLIVKPSVIQKNSQISQSTKVIKAVQKQIDSRSSSRKLSTQMGNSQKKLSPQKTALQVQREDVKNQEQIHTNKPSNRKVSMRTKKSQVKLVQLMRLYGI